MRYQLQFAEQARRDLDRLHEFLAEKDVAAADRALLAISKAWAILKDFPHSCRKGSPYRNDLRELLISFGHAGYVALFEIEDDTVTVLAVRHQREDDYH